MAEPPSPTTHNVAQHATATAAAQAATAAAQAATAAAQAATAAAQAATAAADPYSTCQLLGEQVAVCPLCRVGVA
jgi:hypothetical protein